MSLPPLMAHQARGIEAMRMLRALKEGPVLGVAPPGAGKSRCMFEIAKAEVENGGRAVIMAHRKMLLDQLVKAFSEVGMDFGVIAPGYQPDPGASVQIVSSQAIFHRAVLRGSIDLPEASLVIKDEAHQQAGTMARAMVFGSIRNNIVQEGWANRGADVIGFTATPVFNARMYSRLTSFGTYSELRRVNMHLPIRTFSPSEIDTAGLQPNASGEYAEKALEERVMKIYGDVFEHYHIYNPRKLPAILFAPSVASSRWFAHRFHDDGIPCAHIDGDSCLISENGKLEPYASTKEVRDRILEMSKSGEIKIVTNRFVLREAIDMPWLKHAIFATVMRSLTTFLQSVGRLQRYWPDYTEKILQDHGGTYHRHGSANDDRMWRLGLTNKIIEKERIERLNSGAEQEGICCPKCKQWRKRGPVCINPECRHAHTQSVRSVRMVSGRLKQITGQVYVHQHDTAPDQNRLWMQQIYIGASRNLTAGQCVAIFRQRCEKAGIAIDLNKLRVPMPNRDTVQWDYLAKDVWPWAAKTKKNENLA